MNQNSGTKSFWQVAYEPLPNPWVFYVRCAQLFLTLVTIGLTAYAASQLIIGSGINFTFFAAVWSLLWIGASTWGLAYIPAHYRPNSAALAMEATTCLWWLVTLGLLGTTASAYATVLAAYDAYGLKTKRSPYTTSDSTTSSSEDYAASVASSVSETLNLPNWRAGTHATQVATAVAALNWVLFILTTWAVIKKIRLLRAGQTQTTQQQNTDNAFSVHPHGNSFDTDKRMHTPSNVV